MRRAHGTFGCRAAAALLPPAERHCYRPLPACMQAHSRGKLPTAFSSSSSSRSSSSSSSSHGDRTVCAARCAVWHALAHRGALRQLPAHPTAAECRQHTHCITPWLACVLQGAHYQKPRKIPMRIEPKTFFGAPPASGDCWGKAHAVLLAALPQRAALPTLFGSPAHPPCRAASPPPQPPSPRFCRGWPWHPPWAPSPQPSPASRWQTQTASTRAASARWGRGPGAGGQGQAVGRAVLLPCRVVALSHRCPSCAPLHFPA